MLKKPKIMYRADLHFKNEIVEREVVKQTDKSVWFIRERFSDGYKIQERELKETTYYKWFNTKAGAIDYLHERSKSHIRVLEGRLTASKKGLIDFEQLHGIRHDQ